MDGAGMDWGSRLATCPPPLPRPPRPRDEGYGGADARWIEREESDGTWMVAFVWGCLLDEGLAGLALLAELVLRAGQSGQSVFY